MYLKDSFQNKLWACYKNHARLYTRSLRPSGKFMNRSSLRLQSGTRKFSSGTVRLLTHALCKPTHFFFYSFIATMPYCLQTSFISVMKGWAVKYYVWGAPTRSPSRSNSRLFKHAFFHTKKEQIYTCSYIISVVHMCRIISWVKVKISGP